MFCQVRRNFRDCNVFLASGIGLKRERYPFTKVKFLFTLVSVIVALLCSPETKGHVFTSELAVVP